MKHRIEVLHRPHDYSWPWGASIYTEDGGPVAVLLGDSPDDVEAKARQWVVRENTPVEPTRELWVDEWGRDAVAPEHSDSRRV